MLDDFRSDLDTGSFLDEVDEVEEEEYRPRRVYRRTSRRIFGMTPFQRFIVSLELFIMVLILGTFFLLITEKIAPPIPF